ncbi:MAG: N-acyl-D-amino-acid deacylase family protein [Acidobacteriaceae bacterium]
MLGRGGNTVRDAALVGGMIVDGTGTKPFPANLFVTCGRISGVSSSPPPSSAEVIDCTGLVIAPGFIDAHSHSDLQVLENAPEKLLQGVTSEIVGNCGFSAYPTGERATELREFANGIFSGDESWGWHDARSYIADTGTRCRTGVSSLVGHGSLRVAVAGHQLGPLPERSMDAMVHMLDDALDEGAVGLSTGLMYSPGASSPVEELDRLCSVVVRHNRVYATHIRNYSDEVCEALQEQIGIATRTGCRLQISHLQVVGPRNWDKQQQALEIIERARQGGVDIAFDCYPYTRGSTVLTQLVPQWALEGGLQGLQARLGNRGERRSICLEMDRTVAQGWPGILISAVRSSARQDLVGLSIADIAEIWNAEPALVVLDLLVQEGGAVNILGINQSEANLKQTLTHPLSMIISDGFYVRGRPHPRLYGTFPLLLGDICRRRKWLSLEEAVEKITYRPAQRFGLQGRGKIESGYYADLTIFDPEEIDSAATYENPSVAPAGIRYVLREGEILVEDGRVANHVTS